MPTHHSFNTTMSYDLYNLSITPAAAMYMHAKKLCMRNSNTKQTESMHYGRRNFPETHSQQEGVHYCTPLYTIAIPQLLQDIETQKKSLNNRLSSDVWDQEYAPVNLLTLPSSSTVISDFVDKIREQVINFTSFGYMFNHFYDYELLIAPSDSLCLDDLGRYPTGGRSHQQFNSNTIIYRVTFNEIEVKFFKEILSGTFDQYFHPQDERSLRLSDDMLKTIRTTICNQLATEVIVSKLIIFLNTCGHLKQVIAFSQQHLEILLKKTIVSCQGKLDNQIRNKLISCVAAYQYDQYQAVNKYTQLRTIQLPTSSPLALSPQHKAIKRCRSIVGQYRLGISKYISEVNHGIDNLRTKIGSPEDHHFPEAVEKVKFLLAELTQARDTFYQLYLKTSRVDEIKYAKHQFQARCQNAIHQAMPVLERDLEWRDYLLNLLKVMLNGVVELVTAGNCNTFFSYRRSDSVKEVESIDQLTCSA